MESSKRIFKATAQFETILLNTYNFTFMKL